MIRCAFAIPGDLASPTGGYTYARKVLPLLAKKIEISVCSLPGSFPFPSSADLIAVEAALETFNTRGNVVLFDGLAYGAMPVALVNRLKASIVVLVHHPLGLETGLSQEQSLRLLQTEKSALVAARHIVVSSRATARTLTDLFDVSDDRISVAEPGLLRGKKALGTRLGQPPHIVSVGAITPRKGFEVLVKALNLIRDLEWRATIAGALDRSPEAVSALRAQIDDYGLDNRVELAGPMDEGGISALYTSGDIFALASYYEGYGMAFAEAMAHGLPVVASGDGAVCDTVPEAAGVICSVGDVESFASALKRMLIDRSYRTMKAEGAWRHGQTLADWPETTNIIAGVLQRVAA